MANDTEHPDPETWWYWRRVGFGVGLVGLIGEAAGVLWLGVPEHGAAILEYVALGFLLLIGSYVLGATLVDIVKAWRSG
jgi:hypothetical protein